MDALLYIRTNYAWLYHCAWLPYPWYRSWVLQPPEEAVPAQEEGAEERQVVEVGEVKLAADAEQVLLEDRHAGLHRLLEDPLEALEQAWQAAPFHLEREWDTTPIKQGASYARDVSADGFGCEAVDGQPYCEPEEDGFGSHVHSE